MAGQKAKRSKRWLEGVRADTPLVEAAKIAVETRLTMALSRLEDVGSADGPDDPDDLRKLRVSLRRANVALRAFAECLPGRKSQRLRRQMNRIRRAAGDVRDCDVHLGILDEALRECAEHTVALVHVRDAMLERREKKQNKLGKVIDTQLPRIRRNVAALLASLESHCRGSSSEPAAPGTATLCDAAAAMLPPMLEEATFALRRDLYDPEALHDLRIACRRLRYALELLAAALPSTVRQDVYPQLVRIQDQMGAAGDLATFIERLENLADRADSKEQSETAQELNKVLELFRTIHNTKSSDAIEFLKVSGIDELREVQRSIQAAFSP